MSTTTAEPAPFLPADQITSLVPGIDDAWAKLYQDAVTALLAQLTGGSGAVPTATEALVRLQLVSAVRRHGLGKPWLKAETIGPFSATYETVADELLDDRALARLADLLGVTREAPTAGGARGTFPAPGGWDHLFIEPADLRAAPVGVVVYSVALPAPAPAPAPEPAPEPVPEPTPTAPAPTVRADFASYFEDGGAA